MASSVFQNTDEAIVENGSSAAAVVADRGGGRERERVFPPSSIGLATFGAQSQRGNAFVSQTRKGKRERGGREEGKGGWMIAAATAGALGFVQRATRRTSQPARKNLAARKGEGGRE